MIQVRRLQSTEDLERYIQFGAVVYAGNPYWVPTDPHHLMSLLTGQKEAGSHWRVQPFWVEEGGKILATLTAVVDEEYNRHWKEHTGHLLLFEALSGQDAGVQALFSAACDWLREQGCRAARASFLYAWQLPWTIDAYASVPTFFHTYNPAYYHSYAKNAGFRTEQGMVQYQIAFSPELEARYREMVAHAEGAGVRLRPWNLDRLGEEVTVFTSLLNDTFAGHWGSPPFTLAQMQGFLTAFKDVLIPNTVNFAEVDGRAVGFVVCFPDLNQALHRLGGRSPEEHQEEFQRYVQEIGHGVLLIIGVESGSRGRGINLGLAARSYLAMMERGYKTGSYTVVLDDNWASRRTAEKLGGRVTRNFVTYRRELG